MIKISFILIIASLCFYSCNNDNLIYNNRSFKEMCVLAQGKSKPFCIVLVDSVQNSSKNYQTYVQGNYKYLTKKAIYNMVDIGNVKNDWYVKWLCPTTTPLTCLFSSQGELIDIIPGSSREAFLYSNESIKQMSITDFHWPNRFGMNKKEVIPLLNNVLFHKNIIAEGICDTDEIDNLIDSLFYPYVVYLKLTNQLMVNDTVSAKRSAELLITFETPYYLELFRTEIITAKKIIDPNFNLACEPNIRVNNQNIELHDCVVNATIPIKVIAYNDGEKPLKISKIKTSCSCVKNLDDSNMLVINARDSIALSFEFTPDLTGEITRNIYIVSNSINKPLLNICISANSISNR